MSHTATTATTAETPPDQYDTPWKRAIERYFPEFMAFFFPQAFTQIGWDRGYTFLENELVAITKDAELGKRFADKLVQVYRTSGEEELIYIHLEVQGTAQAEFAERMFVYHYRIYDYYRRPVASMAVLADDSPTWKPQEFAYNTLDCQLSLRYPVVKLQDYAGQEYELADNPNPFALVTLAHLQTQATRKDPNARYEAMWKLVQLLYDRGWERQRVLDLLFMLDWMMTLPDYLSKTLWQNIHELKQEKIMAYVSSFERFATEAGKLEGKLEGMQIGEALALQKLLTKRFGAVPADTVQKIATADTAQIDAWLDQVLDAPNLDVLFGATCH